MPNPRNAPAADAALHNDANVPCVANVFQRIPAYDEKIRMRSKAGPEFPPTWVIGAQRNQVAACGIKERFHFL
jgi:hypothetical protein